MKLTLSTVLATALLAASAFANAQATTPTGNQELTPPQAMAAPTVKAGGYDALIAPAVIGNSVRTGEDTSKKDDTNRMAPDDPRKNPYWDPKDYRYIMQNSGG